MKIEIIPSTCIDTLIFVTKAKDLKYFKVQTLNYSKRHCIKHLQETIMIIYIIPKRSKVKHLDVKQRSSD